MILRSLVTVALVLTPLLGVASTREPDPRSVAPTTRSALAETRREWRAFDKLRKKEPVRAGRYERGPLYREIESIPRPGDTPSRGPKRLTAEQIDPDDLQFIENWWHHFRQTARQPFDSQTQCPGGPSQITPNGEVLRCWLALNPQVAAYVTWEELYPDGTVVTKSYASWSADQKDELDVAFYHAYQWLNGGLASFTGTQVQDPPFNQASTLGLDPEDQPMVTVLSRDDAWDLYVATLAHGLAVEIGGFVPWSVLGMSPTDWSVLFSSSKLVGAGEKTYVGNIFLHGYFQNTAAVIGSKGGSVTHSPPTTVFPFLVAQNIVQPTHYGTISRLLRWSRENVYHSGSFGGETHAERIWNHWQYYGSPPVKRILDGTHRLYPGGNVHPNLLHWVQGCHSVTNLFVSVLRSVNIPARRFRNYHYSGVESSYLPPIPEANHGTGHTVPLFTSIGRTLSHGDDAFSVRYNLPTLGPVLPDDAVMIDFDQFDAWFNPWHEPDEDQRWANVSRQIYEIALDILPENVMDAYCNDLDAGLPWSEGEVFAIFDRYYSFAELVNLDLWGRLDDKRAALAHCPAPTLTVPIWQGAIDLGN